MSSVKAVRVRDFGFLTGGLAALAIAVAGLRAVPGIHLTTVGLTLLLVVLVTATVGRLWVATVVAIAATAAYNFYFFPPIGTFTITDPQNWVAVIAFLVAAVIASNLSAAARAQTQDAIARRNEVTRLFELSRDVLLTTESTGAIEMLARHVAGRFDFARVAICLPTDRGWRLHQGGIADIRINDAALNDALTRANGLSHIETDHVRGIDAATVLVPLRHGTRAIGLLAAETPSLDRRTLDAIAGVVAIAIERTQLLDEREGAELVRQRADFAAALLASLSHDLKTPLTATRVAVENLRGELDTVERQAQADAAITELDRLNRLFQDILDMARIDAAAIHVERQWVTPSDVVDAAMVQARHALDGHRLRVSADADIVVEIDPRIASMALSHLLENAAHYSARDHQIAIDARALSDELRVTVTDSGPGLDPDEYEHLFERFFRGQRARRLVPGTGMGLAITRGLLTAAGGRVWAENVPTAGARFTIVLPGRTRAAVVSQ